MVSRSWFSPSLFTSQWAPLLFFCSSSSCSTTTSILLHSLWKQVTWNPLLESQGSAGVTKGDQYVPGKVFRQVKDTAVCVLPPLFPLSSSCCWDWQGEMALTPTDMLALCTLKLNDIKPLAHTQIFNPCKHTNCITTLKITWLYQVNWIVVEKVCFLFFNI